MEKPQKGPNDKIDQTDLAASRKRKDEIFRDLSRKLGYSISDKELNLETDRKNLYQATIKDVLITPLEYLDSLWSFKLRELEARKNMGEAVTVATLQKEVEPLAKEMAEMIRTTEAYIHEMTQHSEGKKLTPEVLSKMINGIGAKSSTVADALLLDKAKYGDLIEAMKWALGMSKKIDGTEHSVAYSEDESIAALKKHLKDPTIGKFVWTIITFMDPEEKKISFLADYVKSEPDPLKVLEEGNLQGALSSVEMEEILTKSGKSSDNFTAKRAEYDAKWNAQQKTVLEQAKYMMHSSVGAKLVLPTLKGTVMFLVSAFAVGTLTANTLVSFFYKGRFKDPAAAIKSAVTNPWSLLAGGALALKEAATTDEKPGEYVKKTDSASIEHSKANIRTLIKGEPELVKFLDLDNFAGMQAIYDFGQYVRKIENDESNPLPEKYLTLEGFNNWLNTQPQFAKVKKENFPIKDEEKFATLVRSVYVLKLGETHAKNYKNEIKETA